MLIILSNGSLNIRTELVPRFIGENVLKGFLLQAKVVCFHWCLGEKNSFKKKEHLFRGFPFFFNLENALNMQKMQILVNYVDLHHHILSDSLLQVHLLIKKCFQLWVRKCQCRSGIEAWEAVCSKVLELPARKLRNQKIFRIIFLGEKSLSGVSGAHGYAGCTKFCVWWSWIETPPHCIKSMTVQNDCEFKSKLYL